MSIFFAVKTDMIKLLNFIYDETDCRVYESYSEYGKNLREFKSVSDILEAHDLGICKTRDQQTLLQLYSPSTKGRFLIEKINLDPAKCNGHKLRYAAGGWGLIQLYLGGVYEVEKKIVHSYLGHNTENRALKWATTYPDYGNPNEFDWKALTFLSKKITHHIKKELSNHTEAGCSVLTNATKLTDQGYSLKFGYGKNPGNK